jgi:hypothetical protein
MTSSSPSLRSRRPFNSFGVGDSIGGSVASTSHGAIRSTMDVDLVGDLRSDQVAEFISTFRPECYVSEAAVRDAVERRRGTGWGLLVPAAFRDQESIPGVVPMQT